MQFQFRPDPKPIQCRVIRAMPFSESTGQRDGSRFTIENDLKFPFTEGFTATEHIYGKKRALP